MPHYSHSQLQTFEDCPQKYKFKYLDKIEKPEKESIEAFVGSRVHDVLEKLYKDLLQCKLNSLDELLAHYRNVWEREWEPTIKIVNKNLTPQNWFEYGVKCIRNYYERYKPFDESQTIDTEARIVFALNDQGNYKLQGYIDRIARRPDGTWEIHDYKSGGHLPAQTELDTDRQLALYQIGLKTRWRDIEHVELVWHYVGFDTTLRSRRTPEQLKNLAAQTITVIDQIEQEKEFEPRQSRLCDWCEYREDCPLWKHVEAVESLPPAEFAGDEGVRLANDYAKTRFEIDRLEARLEELRRLVIEFCRQKQVNVVAGKGVRVKVKFEEEPRFPVKDDPQRASLEDFVRRLGRWDDVSDLNLNQLGKILKEKQWEPKLLEKLRQFATTESSVRVAISRTKEREDAE
jgi:RecB family exonuclease